MKQKKILLAAMLFLLMVTALRAGDGFTQKDRELLIELRVRMMEMDKRFEQIDKRFEQVDKRFDQSDRQIGQMMSFMWMLAGIFATITVSIMSLLFWDRRTMIRPFEKKVAEIETEIAQNKKVNGTLLDVLKEYAKKDRKFAEVLSQFIQI
jgi:chromosome segregation ATPase